MQDRYVLKRGFHYSRHRRPTSAEFAYPDEVQTSSDLRDICARSWQHWQANPFEYSVNSWGHRGSEFRKNGLVMLGCSYTWGWGMSEQWSWPWLVGDRLGMAVNCLGYPGEGGDRASMLALGWIRELEPRVVYFLDLFTTRRTWLMQWQPAETLFMNHDAPEGREPHLEILQKIACSEAQEWFDQQRNLAVIRQECSAVGAGLVYMDRDLYKQHVVNKKIPKDQDLLSRDRGNHPSRLQHQLIADYMSEQSQL
jgi:hypothetical protein